MAFKSVMYEREENVSSGHMNHHHQKKPYLLMKIETCPDLPSPNNHTNNRSPVSPPSPHCFVTPANSKAAISVAKTPAPQ